MKSRVLRFLLMAVVIMTILITALVIAIPAVAANDQPVSQGGTPWQLIIAVIGVIAAAGWGTIITLSIKASSSIKKIRDDIKEIQAAGGSPPDAVYLDLGKNVYSVYVDGGNIFKLLKNMAIAIGGVLRTYKMQLKKPIK